MDTPSVTDVEYDDALPDVVEDLLVWNSVLVEKLFVWVDKWVDKILVNCDTMSDTVKDHTEAQTMGEGEVFSDAEFVEDHKEGNDDDDFIVLN